MSVNTPIRLLLLAMVVVVMACGAGPTFQPSEPVVIIAGVAFPVERAITPAQHVQGLSGRPKLDPGTGMLFIFDQELRRSFWMKDMHFPLDMVWINAQCVVADITHNAPPPTRGQTTADLPLYTPKGPAMYVLEINAGEAESAGIQVGDPVHYTGSLTGRGC